MMARLYQSDMKDDSFKGRLVNRFINYLENESIIILDNASYHPIIVHKVPNTGSHKKTIFKNGCKKNYSL
jgi:hypothetical protein